MAGRILNAMRGALVATTRLTQTDHASLPRSCFDDFRCKPMKKPRVVSFFLGDLAEEVGLVLAANQAECSHRSAKTVSVVVPSGVSLL